MINRESAIAGACLLITLAIAWLLDHPRKVAGTVVLLVAFAVFVAVAHLRGPGRPAGTRRLIRKAGKGGDGE